MLIVTRGGDYVPPQHWGRFERLIIETNERNGEWFELYLDEYFGVYSELYGFFTELFYERHATGNEKTDLERFIEGSVREYPLFMNDIQTALASLHIHHRIAGRFYERPKGGGFSAAYLA